MSCITPRILTIQDYSCMGRCSLTVALPIISCCGCECVGLPSTVLSNHTQFKSFKYVDLNDELIDFVSCWDSYNHHFDYIYTGYLSTSQIENVIEIIKKLKTKETKVIIDPAMADNGKLYPSFNNNHINKMKELLKYADYIIPNLTEVCFLLDKEYKEYSIDDIISIIKEFNNSVIMTGIRNNKNISTILKENNSIQVFNSKIKKGVYHGTGDLFASAFVGTLAKLNNIDNAITIAQKMVSKSIDYTLEEKKDGLIYGPSFERAIPYLIKELKKATTK